MDERTGEIDPPAERRNEPLDEHQDLLRVGEMDRGLLEPPVAFDPDTPGAVDHDLRHPIVAQQRGELAKTEEAVFEPPLEQAQLPRGDDQPLVHERLAQRRRKLLAARTALRRFTKTRDHAALDAGARRDRHVASVAMISANSS